VIVVALPTRVNHADAFSVWAGGESLKPLIALVGGWPGDRQRFSLAHELGHLVLHQDLRRSPGTLDDEADLFASEFLLPSPAMQDELRPPLTLTRLAELKARWGVSVQVLARRAERLGVISLGQRKYIEKQLVSKGWIWNEPVEIPPEKPRLIRKMAEDLFGNPPDLARLVQAVGPISSKFVSELIAEQVSSAEPVNSGIYGSARPERTESQGRDRVLQFRRRKD
jgi:Zn-dependent peptidase ImmA (M78 family)